MAQKITPKTTDLFVGTILKVINIKENTPFQLNKFYPITDGDGVGALFVGGYSDVELTMHELGDYFEHIASLEDIENLESKALILKETFEQLKIMSESAEDEISNEALINETIAFLVQDEVYQCDEIELRFICDNMDISMIERCSCCGKTIMPDDECYEDDLNDGAALCDHCSVYDDGRNMYIKTVHQDVIEKLTGYKFSPHLGNVGSKIEEFNYWINKHEHKFGFKEPKSKDIFIEFINEYSEWNICDCCLMIEKSDDLTWLGGEFFNDEYIAVSFINSTFSDIVAICQNCLNMFISRTHLSLHEIVQRLKQNEMVYRIGDIVTLKDLNYKEKNTNHLTYIDYIVSFDENTKTYKLKSYGDVQFKEEDFYDIANEAYVNEYTKFIAKQHPELSENVDSWAEINEDGIPDINDAFISFGYKKEFIEQLKANNLPYDRFIDENEEIIEKLDEVDIVKNDILHNIFCINADNDIVVPTFNELVAADKYQSNWQLTEDYQDYSLPSIIQIVNELTENFFTTLEVLNSHKEMFRRNKKYGYRQRVEFGSPIELVCELQEIFNIYSNGVIYPETELVLLQDSRRTEDYSSIEILLKTPIKFDELSSHLKSTLKDVHHDEVNLLIEAIKQAKADNHETLCVYDC